MMTFIASPFFNNKLICFSFIHKGGAMFITQQQGDGDGYNVPFLEWAAAQAETIGPDAGGVLMYFTIIGYSSF